MYCTLQGGIVSVQLMTNIDVYLGIKPPGVEPSVFWIRAGIDWRRQSEDIRTLLESWDGKKEMEKAQRRKRLRHLSQKEKTTSRQTPRMRRTMMSGSRSVQQCPIWNEDNCSQGVAHLFGASSPSDKTKTMRTRPAVDSKAPSQSTRRSFSVEGGSGGMTSTPPAKQANARHAVK